MTPDPRVVAELYDEKAREYDQHYRRPTDAAEDDVLYGWVRQYMPDAASLLDVGCGTGEGWRHLRPLHYTGVDISQAMIARALGKVPESWGARWVQGDFCGMSDVDFAQKIGGLYDTAISLWAFPHFKDPVGAVMRMRQAVRPGGHVIVQGFAERYARRPNYILNGHGSELLLDTTPDDLARYADIANLHVIDVRGFRFHLDKPWMERLPRRLLAAGMRTTSLVRRPENAATHVLIAQRPL